MSVRPIRLLHINGNVLTKMMETVSQLLFTPPGLPSKQVFHGGGNEEIKMSTSLILGD